MLKQHGGNGHQQLQYHAQLYMLLDGIAYPTESQQEVLLLVNTCFSAPPALKPPHTACTPSVPHSNTRSPYSPSAPRALLLAHQVV